MSGLPPFPAHVIPNRLLYLQADTPGPDSILVRHGPPHDSIVLSECRGTAHWERCTIHICAIMVLQIAVVMK